MIKYLLIPVYNEADNIEKLSRALENYKSDEFFIVFSDDCSKDNSVKLLKEHFSDYHFHVIENSVNQGPGGAFNTGFEWILDHSTSNDDLLITMEADGTSDLAILPVMTYLAQDQFDLVLASVYAQGGGFSSTSFLRKYLSFAANMLFRSLFDVKVLTMSSFYRVYKISLIRRLKEEEGAIITETGFICMLEVLLKAIKHNSKIIEVPMILQSQKRVGKSKMKVLKTSIEYLRFLFKAKF